MKALDVDADGTLSGAEIRVMVARLLQVPESEIPENHRDVAPFVGLSVDKMVEKLCTVMSGQQVDAYFEAMHVEHEWDPTEWKAETMQLAAYASEQA